MEEAARTFENFVLYSLHAHEHAGSDGGKLQEASHFINQVKASDEVWDICLERFCNSEHAEMRFFCLSVFGDLVVERSDSADYSVLKQSLFSYIKEYLPDHQEEPIYVRNKAAQVVALLFRHEYLTTWPSFFDDVIDMLSIGSATVDAFLRILKSIDEMVFSKELLKSAAFEVQVGCMKDQMRDTCVVQLAEIWMSVLEQLSDEDGLVGLTLDVIGRYVAWIEIHYIANDTMMPLILSYLERDSTRCDAIACLEGIVCKGTEPAARVRLIGALHVESLVRGIMARAGDEDVYALQLCLAQFLTKVGTLLIDAWIKLIKEPAEETEAAGDMGIGILQVTCDFVDQAGLFAAVMPLQTLGAYVSMLKNVRELSPEQNGHLEEILNVVTVKMRMPDGYEYEHEDEDESDIASFRQEAETLMKKVAKVAPEMVAEKLHADLRRVLQSECPVEEVEAALVLLYWSGEMFRRDAQKPERSDVFGPMLTLLFESDVACHPHLCVRAIYFNLVNRFGRFLQFHPSMLGTVMGAFLDVRGLRCPHDLLRKRACILFSRLMKQLKGHVSTQPALMAAILSKLSPLICYSPEQLIAGERELSDDDQICVTEGLAWLLGCDDCPAEMQRAYVEEILTPVVNRMAEMIVLLPSIINARLQMTSAPIPFFDGDPDVAFTFFVTYLCHATFVIGTLSKGFSPRLTPEEGDPVRAFGGALDVVLELLKTAPEIEDVRLKVLKFLHCMVDSTGEMTFQLLPVMAEACLEHSGVVDMVEFVSLLNQCSGRFKADMLGLLEDIAPPLCSWFVSYLEQADASTTEEGTVTDSVVERGEVLRIFLPFLHTNLLHGLAPCFVSDAMMESGLFERVLAIVGGCAHDGTIGDQRTAFQIYQNMMQAWLPKDAEHLPGFDEFVCAQVIVTCFQVPFSLNLADAQTKLLLLGEISLALQIACDSCGDLAAKALFGPSGVLGELGCASHLQQEFGAALGCSPKAFKNTFITFLQALGDS